MNKQIIVGFIIGFLMGLFIGGLFWSNKYLTLYKKHYQTREVLYLINTR
jgi:ABC-type nitrate/sulfonate/bicarbonate transport system permease component